MQAPVTHKPLSGHGVYQVTAQSARDDQNTPTLKQLIIHEYKLFHT